MVIVSAFLIFSTLSVVSLATPNLSKEIKRDLTDGVQSLCHGDIKSYYNMYNTRKLTEIEKTKFYDKITDTQDIVNSEMSLFKKYKLTIKINEVSVMKKIGDNLFLCNLEVNYKFRKNHDTTETIGKTEDYIVKVIDVGNMDYKILLPFNSLDKDFSSSLIYSKLKEADAKKQADKITAEREKQEELEAQNKEEIINIPEEEHNAQIIENPSDIENIASDKNDDKNNNTENTDDLNEEQSENSSHNSNNNNHNNNQNNNSDINTDTNEDKSSYESFLED